MNIELLTVYVLDAGGSGYARMLVDGEPVELVEYSYVTSRMGATSLTATVRHKRCLDSLWTGREFVVLDEGALLASGTAAVEKFFLDHRPSSSKDNTDERYVHSLEFRAGRDILLSGVYFCDAVNPSAASAGNPQSNGYDVKFVGTLEDFVQRFNDVLSYRGLQNRFSVSVEPSVVGTTESLEISFDKLTLAEVLTKAVEVWGVPFYYMGDSAVFGGADDSPLVSVEYGADNELLSVSMNNRGEKIVTRIAGAGGTDNVPYYYPNPSPKGTLGVGGTASGVTVADQYKFSQGVGLSDVLTYYGRDAVFGWLQLDFGGKTGRSAQGGVTAVVEDVDLVSGTDSPFRVSLGADLSGGFDAPLRIPLSVGVGTKEQVGDDTPLYYVRSYSGGTYNYSYLPAKEVSANGWDVIIDRVEVVFGGGSSVVSREVPFSVETIARDLSGEDGVVDTLRAEVFSAERVSAVVLDFSKILPLFPSGADLSACRVYVTGHLATRVLWQVNTGTGFAPADSFHADSFSAVSVFTPLGWYLGDAPLAGGLSEVGLSMAGEPSVGDTITQTVLSYITPTGRLMPHAYRESGGLVRSYDALNGTYIDPETGEYYHFENEYDARSPHEHIEDFDDVIPSIRNLKDSQGNPLNVLNGVYFDPGYNTRDLLPDGQTLKYQYFFVKLKALGFNLFDCAIENGEMSIVMSDGPCAGCKFKILVDSLGRNPVQKNQNGTLKKDADDFGVLDYDNLQDSQQDTSTNAVWLALYLDMDTFGGQQVEAGVMPSAVTKPSVGNAFTIDNILLPDAFFIAAEQELERRLIKFMADNNADKFNPSVQFSRVYLAENPTVRGSLSARSRLSLTYDGRTFAPLYVSQFTINVREGEALPEILVETSDIIEPQSAGLDDRIASAVRERVVASAGGGGVDFGEADKRYLRRDSEDRAAGKIVFEKGLEVGDYKAGRSGIGGTIYANSAGEAVAEVDFLLVRRKATFTQVEVDAMRKVAGTIILSLADATITAVEKVQDGWKCYFKTETSDGSAVQNGFIAGDQAICRTFQNNNEHYFWRLVTEVGANYITLSESDCDDGSDAPEVGDTIVQLGNRTDSSRQSAQVLSCYGELSPSYQVYAGIDSYSLDGKDIFGVIYRETSSGSGVYEPHFYNYGTMLLGSRDKTEEYIEFADGALNIKGRLVVRNNQGAYVAMDSYMNAVKEQFEIQQAQIDGQTQSWASGEAPTAQTKPYPLWDEETQQVIGTPNYPYTLWADDTEREKHVGDIYMDDTSGQGYRLTKRTSGGATQYFFIRITDEEVALALAVAQQAAAGVAGLAYLKAATNSGATLVDGGLILSNLMALGQTVGQQFQINAGINGIMNASRTRLGGGIAAWFGGNISDKDDLDTGVTDYAKSIFRFDGSGYLAGGNIHWDDQGYGGIPGITWSNDGTNDIVTIGANVRLASVDGDTVTDLLNAVNSIKDWFGIDDDGNIYVKKNGNTARGFYSYGFISAGGISPGGGASAGNAVLVAQTYGGTLSATGINPINFYSKERVDQLLATAGTVQTVAGVSPTSGDIPVASLKSALGLGAAAAYGIGSVASGNTGLVTGGSVYSAINEAVSSVMKMQGTTTTPISDGSTTNPVVIDGSSYTAKKGDVVLYDGKEYLWAGSAWEQLGDEASWALKTTSISAGTGLEGGGTLASNRTISLSAASIASLARADSAVLKSGDTMSGNLIFDNGSGPEAGIRYDINRAGSGGGTWAYSPFVVRDAADNSLFNIGVYGTEGTLSFAYLGTGDFAANNLRIYSTGVSWGAHTIYHAGNSNLDTVNWAANQMVANSFKLASGTPTLTWDANANAWHLSGNFYADGFISAGGVSPGGGASGIDHAAMWASLTNNPADAYASTKISGAHIPDMASTFGYLTSGNFVAGINYVTPQTTLAGYGITDALRIKRLDNSEVLLSNKVYSAGETNKGDFPAQTECPTPYGMYLSLQARPSNNQGFQIYGDTTGGGNYGIYYRARFAGDDQTTYQSWRRVLDEANYTTWINTTHIAHGEAAYNALGNYVLKSGDIMSGTLFTSGSFVVNSHALDAVSPTSQHIVINGYNDSSSVGYCPGIGFHIPGVTFGTLKLGRDSIFAFYDYSLTGYFGVRAAAFYKAGGTSYQFLKADGSVDSNTYLTTSAASSTYVSSVALNGDYLRVTKNGGNTDLLIPYASRAGYVDGTDMGNWNANSPGNYQYLWYYGQGGGVSNFPANLVGTFGSIANFLSGGGSESLNAQLAWGVNHDSTNVSNGIAWRTENNLGWDTTWHRLYDDNYHPTSDKLSTPRLIWGQSFDGTQEVNGDITLAGATNVSNTTYITNTAGFGLLFHYSNGVYGPFFKQDSTVGIGTMDPHYTLDVNGSIGCSTLTASGQITSQVTYGASFRGIQNRAAAGAGGWAEDFAAWKKADASSYIFNIGAYGWDATVLYVYMGCGVNQETTSYALRFYPTYLWYGGNFETTGTIHSSTGIWSEGYVSAGGLASSSDERLKSGIKDFGYSAEMLMALRPREWDWNEKSYMKGHAAGVVAQELRQVMPYAIVERQYLSVNYDMLHGLEIAGLQDHEKRIRQLERENKELRKRLNMN